MPLAIILRLLPILERIVDLWIKIYPTLPKESAKDALVDLIAKNISEQDFAEPVKLKEAINPFTNTVDAYPFRNVQVSDVDDLLKVLLGSIIHTFGEESLRWMLATIENCNNDQLNALIRMAAQDVEGSEVKLKLIALIANKVTTKDVAEKMKTAMLAGAHVARLRENGTYSYIDLDMYSQFVRNGVSAWKEKDTDNGLLAVAEEWIAAGGLAVVPVPDYVKVISDTAKTSSKVLAENGVFGAQAYTSTTTFKRIILS